MEGVSVAKNAIFSEKAQKYMNASSISWQTQVQKHPVTLCRRTDFFFSALLSFSSHLSRINLKWRAKSELGVGKRWRLTLGQYGTSPPSESALDIWLFSVFHSCSCRGCDTDEDPAITLPSKKTMGRACSFLAQISRIWLLSLIYLFFFLSSTHMCTHASSSVCRHSQAQQLSPCLPFRHAKGMKDHEKKSLILNGIFLFHMRRARDKVKAETCSYIVRKSNKFLQRTPEVTCALWTSVS